MRCDFGVKIAGFEHLRALAVRERDLVGQVASAASEAAEALEAGKQDRAAGAAVRLLASGWVDGTQTVEAAGVAADEAVQLIQIVPALASQDAYYEAGVRCVGQAEGSLTFRADAVPSVDLSVYVVIQGVMV